MITRFCSAVPVLGGAFVPPWVGQQTGSDRLYQQPAAAPSLPQVGPAVTLTFGKTPRYHKPAAVFPHSFISASDCICTHQDTGYKACN